jgi:predicted dehydrogenase
VTHPAASRPGASRRDFLAASAATAAGAALASLTPAVHAAGSEVLKVGLIGAGGRGAGAATQALRADPNVKLYAVGDMFEDHIAAKLDYFKSEADIANKIDVKDRCFAGFDAYKKVLASDVDVVILTTPPHFRPLHLKAAVEAGKHVFCEKPVAVDAPGVRSVLDTCRQAKEKKLSVVSGLCYRYENAKRETMKRVHDGSIGDVKAIHTTYNAGLLWSFPREKGWSDMEWQLRNWLYFTWLSGDHIVEQHVHSLDKAAWALKDRYPKSASGIGGRQQRTDPEFGHIFDHHCVVFDYGDGLKVYSYCRQQRGTHTEVSDFIIGTKGMADLMKHNITGEDAWMHKKGDIDDMYQNEHDELFAAIRKGEPINNGEYMCNSSLMGIMGRMATYTGQLITWDMALNSKEDLTPPKYEFGELPVAPVAAPGVTKFV